MYRDQKRLGRDGKTKVEKDLRQIQQVKDFVRRHPEIADQLNSRPFTTCTVVTAKLNAKLIDVKSGEIVWIGDYKLNTLSAGVSNVAIELVQQTSPSNEADIRSFVDFHNRESQRKARGNNNGLALRDWKFNTKLFVDSLHKSSCDARATEDELTQLSRELVGKFLSTIKMSS